MTTQLTITDSGTDSQTFNSTVDSVLGDNEILSERATETTTETETGIEITLRRHVSDAIDPTAIIESLETEGYTVKPTRRWFEYEDETFADDPTYYPYDRATGLRTPPSVTHSDGYTISASADVVVDGTETSIESECVLSPVQDQYARRDRLLTDGDSITVMQGTEVENPAETGVKPEAPDVPTGLVSLGVITLKSHIERVPNGGIKIASLI